MALRANRRKMRLNSKKRKKKYTRYAHISIEVERQKTRRITGEMEKNKNIACVVRRVRWEEEDKTTARWYKKNTYLSLLCLSSELSSFINDGWRLKRRLKCLPFIFTHSSRQWQVHNNTYDARTKRSLKIVFDTFCVYLRSSSLTCWVAADRGLCTLCLVSDMILCSALSRTLVSFRPLVRVLFPVALFVLLLFRFVPLYSMLWHTLSMSRYYDYRDVVDCSVRNSWNLFC